MVDEFITCSTLGGSFSPRILLVRSSVSVGLEMNGGLWKMPAPHGFSACLQGVLCHGLGSYPNGPLSIQVKTIFKIGVTVFPNRNNVLGNLMSQNTQKADRTWFHCPEPWS